MWYRDIKDAPNAVALALVSEYLNIYPNAAILVVNLCHEAYAVGFSGKPYNISQDATSLVKDAHHEGLIRKDRLIVRLDSQGDSLTAIVEGPFAEEWADWDQTIGGSSWESAGGDMMYAMPCDHKNLVAELKAEGYILDLTNYC